MFSAAAVKYRMGMRMSGDGLLELATAQVSLNCPVSPQHWIDHLNPWVVHWSSGVGIRWYGISYVAGLLIGYCTLLRWARQKRIPIARQDVAGLVFWITVCLVSGGKLGYFLFYSLDTLRHNPAELMRMPHGGMSSHGAVVGGIIAIVAFSAFRQIDAWIMLDSAAVLAPIGIFGGRVANFINGELWGKPTCLPWGVIFPAAQAINGINVPRHPSQIYAAVMEGLLLFGFGMYIYRKRLRAGLTFSLVCIFYGVVRMIDDFWREPDHGERVFFGWMTTGQALSIPLILGGGLLLLLRKGYGKRKFQLCEDQPEP